MPRHINPGPSAPRAHAPYNFVPLPERVFTVEEGIEVSGRKIKPWEAHDRFVPGTHSGWVDLTIATLTPLYIRGPIARLENGTWDSRDSRLRPEPYATPGGRPAIPGSSLRGMLRTLIEVLAFAKIQPVSDAKPFFRSVSDDRIGRAYRDRMARGGGRRSGFLCRRGNEWVIAPCEMLRVDRALLPRGTHDGNTPRWEYQQKECWIQKHDTRVSDIKFSQPRDGTWNHGMLVLTGTVPRKKREFVFLFLDPEQTSHAVRVPRTIWGRFHDEDQITQWQEKAFPSETPQNGRRQPPGHLRDGEPVFFLTEEASRSEENPEGFVFLGRAGMFRLPYDLGPSALVPAHLAKAGLDLAEAMFGRVPDDKATEQRPAIKGRVFFEDAVASGGGPDWLEDVIVPRILSAPKVTTFQHYLTQDGTKGTDRLTTYLEGDKTTIRGHKLYWHRWDKARGMDLVKEDPQEHDAIRDALLAGTVDQDTQHTVIRPVKPGVTFAGRIRFENLTDLELGGLLEALQLPEGCHHRLGMGKPLGLGSIRIDARLRLLDRVACYRSWRASGIREDETGAGFREAFRTAMLHHARESGETLTESNAGLRRIARLDVFYWMLAWTSRPSPNSTAYMELQGFKERPVLPTSHAVAKLKEPSWESDPPRPTAGSDSGAGRQQGRPAGGRLQKPARPARGRPGMPFATPRPPSPPAPVPPRAPKPKPVERGQTRRGILQRRGDDWVAVFEGDPRKAVILNLETIPRDCADGASAEFYIAEQSKKAGIKCRLERVGTGPAGA